MKTILVSGMIAAPCLSGLCSKAYLKMKDSARIYYEDHGSGRPILFVHGWTCCSRFWQKNIPELSKKLVKLT